MQKDKENMFQELNDEELSQVAGGLSQEEKANKIVQYALENNWYEYYVDDPAFMEKVFRKQFKSGFSQEVVDQAFEILKQRLGI